MDGIGAALNLEYLSPRELHDSDIDGRVLGLVAFGRRPRHALADDCPAAWIDMPVLDGSTVFEVWHSGQPVVRETAGGIRTARNEDMLFGCLEAELGRSMEETAFDAYCRVFDLIDGRGYGELVRIWNYFPGINEPDAGLERYRRFSIGRHDAFAARRRGLGAGAPAACALGSRSGPLTLCFFAARTPGTAIENPRQVSAYRYPALYGPRAPIFSRAMLCRPGGRPTLFVSGTASIVGHETMHAGDPGKQAAETTGNVRTVVEEARHAGFAGAASRPLLKAYVRRPGDLPVIRTCVEQAFGAAASVVYLQADICRSDLLVEVECVCFAPGT